MIHVRDGMKRQSGFTLIELSIVLVIMGLLLGMGLSSGKEYMAQQKVKTTAQKMEAVQESLALYVARTKRLPCPDTDYDGDEERVDGATQCSNAQTGGTIPWLDLGLPGDAARDAWNNWLVYRVYDVSGGSMVASNALDMSKCDPATAANTTAIVACADGEAPNDFLYDRGFYVKDRPDTAGTGVNLADPLPNTTDGSAPGNPSALTTMPTGAAYVLVSTGADATATGYQAQNLNTLALDATRQSPNGFTAFVAASRSDVAATQFDDLVRWSTILGLAQRAGLGPRPQ
ncbi:MAG: prepilin-type N-terminal cleavage/methylation domain-containing protein [Alphaproteobacteria bacterium]|nr:prepilin-type N-terminal cleavage/methylation domain-containing protein [Alphaproteobacteria bacterium]